MLKNMRKTEYIDYIYNLLKKNHFIESEGEKDLYQNAMYKMLFASDSNSQKSIRSSLNDIGIILNADDKVDTLLFYLVYFILIKTDREFMYGGKSIKAPNQKIMSYLQKINQDFWWIGSQYLLLYDTYIKEVNSLYMSGQGDEHFILYFNSHLKFFHLQWACRPEYKTEIEMTGKVYENAYIEKYVGEYKILMDRYRFLMEKIGKQDFPSYYWSTFISYSRSEKTWEDVIETGIGLDNMLYEMIFSSKLIRKIFDLLEIVSFLKGQSNIANKKIHTDGGLQYLEQSSKLYAEAVKNNNFIMFGSYLMVCQEIKELNERVEILKALSKSIGKAKDERYNDEKKVIWNYDYYDYNLDEIATGELLDFFVTDKNQRKASYRNTLRKRIKIVSALLKYVNICPNYDDIRDIKMIYQEFYIERNYILKAKKYSTILGIFEREELGKLEKKDLIFLEEIYIVLKFKTSNKKSEYIDYNERKQKYLEEFKLEVFQIPFHVKR